MSRNESFLILGGAGLVGRQLAREITKYLQPRQIIIASLRQQEVEEALVELRAMFPDSRVDWQGAWGNVFVRSNYSRMNRAELVAEQERRDHLYNDLYGEIEAAYEGSYLVELIQHYKPDVIIDSINTATAISYQDAYQASRTARKEIGHMLHPTPEMTTTAESATSALDVLLLSQSLPQLVRHIQLLYRAMVEAQTRLYLKIGTTGTGGMGLNIPYTHSEDKPSMKLMTKTAVAFAHTGLLFLMARTPGGPIVKEIKPGGMIGYADVTRRSVKERGKQVYVYNSRMIPLDKKLTLHEPAQEYQQIEELSIPVVDTGENGLFTKGEFEAITALRQMEFITPEEIAREAMLEIKGSNTGFDVIAEIDSSIMNPTYRAGYLRQQVLQDMQHLEEQTGTYSIALGQLGPPEISKLLWEAELLRIEYGKIEVVLSQKPSIISERLHKRVQTDARLRHLITSIGLPVLTPDGKHMIRGPFIRIPEIMDEDTIDLTPESIDQWARKGWLDLRSQNFRCWQERFERMHAERQRIRGRGSAAITREAYLFDEIRIGEIVGWIFNNEADGYRIK